MADGDLDLFASGAADRYKGGVHLVMFGLACAMGLYGVGQWLLLRDRLHAINVVAYLGVLAPFEAVQVARHWGR